MPTGVDVFIVVVFLKFTELLILTYPFSGF